MKHGFDHQAEHSTMNNMPHEFALGGTYMSPLLIATLLGALAALATTHLLNRYRLYKYFAAPQVVQLALIVIYTVFFSTCVIKG